MSLTFGYELERLSSEVKDFIDKDGEQVVTTRYPNLLDRMFGRGSRYKGNAKGEFPLPLHKLSLSIRQYLFVVLPK